MNEPNYLQQVESFHKLFDVPVECKPIIPDEKRTNLRIEMLEEELLELKEAIHKNDLIAVADALCDLQYVLSGTILEFGMGELFQDLFDEIHRSNMSKACPNKRSALDTKAYYREEKHIETVITTRDDHFLIHRRKDGKVLKSVDYQAPQLEQYFNAQ